MKIETETLALLGAIGLFTVSPTVLADVAPPSDYVEECTIEKQCSPGQQCLECPGSYEDYDSTPFCEKTYGSMGYTKQCTTWGGSFWEEIWCRPISDSQDQDSSTQAHDTDAGQLVQPTNCSSINAGGGSDESDSQSGGSSDESDSRSDSSCSLGWVSVDKSHISALVILAAAVLIITIRRKRRH